MIHKTEVRDVATYDIPGLFLQTYYDKWDINIKMEGAMVTLLKYVDPEYYKGFICIYRRGRKIMYIESKKAIYFILEASILFCK